MRGHLAENAFGAKTSLRGVNCYTRYSQMSSDGSSGKYAAPLSTLLPTYDRLLNRFMPPSLLIDENFALIHSFAGAEKFLRVNSGRPSSNILELIQPELRTYLSGALQHSKKEQKPVTYHRIPTADKDSGIEHSISVEPFTDSRRSTLQFLVSFQSDQGAPLSQEFHSINSQGGQSLTDATIDYVSQLESELTNLKENLQATIEELETSNEELQAANEELVASNEELQSTNEELQSVNEELFTVNVENQKRISDLTELSNDIENLLTSANVGVVFLDRQLQIRKFTPKIAELFDLIPSDIGRRITSFKHSFRYDGLLDDLESVLARAEPIEREVTDVNNSPLLLRILPYETSQGIDGAVMTVIDISSLKAAESLLMRMRAIVESSEDAIISMDLDGTIRTWNRGAVELYQYTNEEILGQSISNIVPEDRKDELNEIFAQIRSGKKIAQLETVRRRKDGSEVPVSLQNSPIRDKTGDIIGISAIHRDSTQQQETARVLAQAIEKADRASEAKSAFLAHISHEIRTPLASIMGLVDVLESDQFAPGEADQAFDMIRRSGNYLMSLINDLLDLAKVEAGKLEIEPTPLSLHDLLREIQDLMRYQVEEKLLQFHIHTHENVPRLLRTDEKRVRQILMNLLSNAVKFTDRGQVSVTVNYDPQNSLLSTTVSDTGPGIEPSQQQRLFEPFTQLDGNDKFRGGTGLGLSITKRLVELLGGSISLDSVVGQGSHFRVQIPMEIVPTDNPEVGKFERPKRHPLPSANGSPILQGRRILVVEDTRPMQMIIERYLTVVGASVDVVTFGQQAIDKVAAYLAQREAQYHAVLLDMNLPDMSGQDVSQAIQKLGIPLPVIALTANAMVGDRQSCLEVGCVAYLSKPIDRAELINTLAEILQADSSNLT